MRGAQWFFLSLVLLGLVGTFNACGRLQTHESKPRFPWPQVKIKVRHFTGCEEISNDIGRRLSERAEAEARYEAWLERKRERMPVPEPVVLASESRDQVTSNLQEVGVDESDFVRSNGELIFTALPGQIQVVAAEPLAAVGVLSTEDLFDVEMFVTGERLVVLGQSGMRPNAAVARVYRLDGKNLPQVEFSRTLSGRVLGSRVKGERLFLVTQTELPAESGAGYEAQASGVACSDIMESPIPDYDWRLTTVFSLDLANASAEPKGLALLGGGDHLYVSPDSIYVVKEGVRWVDWHEPTAQEQSEPPLVISKVSYDGDSGELRFAGLGKVSGRPIGSWAFKEFAGEGTLAVATTTGFLNPWEGMAPAENHLWLMKSDEKEETLQVVSSINGFGKTENIRAVRYVDRHAYVVTFKRTDPLFAFDLSDLLNPKAVGELKIPGFSTYLHPAGEGRMIGLGYDTADDGEQALTQGVQVSLFDTAKPENLSRLDVKTHGGRFSFSDAVHDHRAFFADAERGAYAFPLVERSVSGTLAFSGAAFYTVKDDRLQEQGRITHKAWIPQICLSDLAQGQAWNSEVRSIDVNRIYRVGDRIYTVSRYGTRVFNVADLTAPVGEARTPGLEQTCFETFTQRWDD